MSQTQYEDQTDELYSYVVRDNHEAVRQILSKHPYLANQIFQKETLLNYPCRHGKIEMIKLLIKCGVDVNNLNQIGSPPLLYAIVFNNFDVAKLLCQNGAKVEGIIVQDSLNIIDLTVLHGRYEAATYIFKLISDKTLKTPEQYSATAKKYHLRYVNYPLFIEGIIKGKSITQAGDFLTKPKFDEDSDQEEPCCCGFLFSKKKEEVKSSKTENPEHEEGTDRKMNQKQ